MMKYKFFVGIALFFLPLICKGEPLRVGKGTMLKITIKETEEILPSPVSNYKSYLMGKDARIFNISILNKSDKYFKYDKEHSILPLIEDKSFFMPAEFLQQCRKIIAFSLGVMPLSLWALCKIGSGHDTFLNLLALKCSCGVFSGSFILLFTSPFVIYDTHLRLDSFLKNHLFSSSFIVLPHELVEKHLVIHKKDIEKEQKISFICSTTGDLLTYTFKLPC